jgi:hypothetical protein
VRCIEAIALAPVYCVCSWADFGIPIILPLQSQDSYWAKYWEKCHKEMDEYGKKPICKAKLGQPHTMIPNKVPKPEDCTFRRFSVPFGGY